MEDKVQKLFARLDKNLAEFRRGWEDMSINELIASSGEITAFKDAHHYLTESHGFEADEVDYLLKFENPLQVVADKWMERTEDLSDFSFALNEVFDKQDALRDYPLKEDAAPERPSVLAKLRSNTSNLAPKPPTPGKEQEAR